MFFDAQQVEQAILADPRQQRPQHDRERRLVDTVVLVLAAQSAIKLFRKQADDGTHRCW